MDLGKKVKLLEAELFNLKSVIYNSESYSQNVQKNVLLNEEKQEKTNIDIIKTINGVDEKMSYITPYMDSQRAYIGDTSVMFENIKNGLITVYCETDSGVVIPTKSEKTGDRLTVSFDTLEEPATITISIM